MIEQLRVLLVEDNPADADLVMEMLTEIDSQGFMPVTANRLSAAFTELEQHPCNVVLLDLSLPDSHGLNTFHLLHERYPELSIVVLTGLKDDRLGVHAVHAGAQDYLVKGSFDAVQLARVARYAVGRGVLLKALHASARFSQAVIDTISGNIAILDETGTIIGVNEGWRRFADENQLCNDMYGLGLNYLDICTLAVQQGDLAAQTMVEGLRTLLARQAESVMLEYPCHSPDQQRWFLCRATCFEVDGRLYVVVVHENVTELKQAEEQLRYQAFHDSLTNLPNRILLLERLERALERTQYVKQYTFAVLFLDLDRFKIINDSLGHLVGDELLVAIARRLETVLIQSGDLVARFGGDEFVIFLDNLKDSSSATRVVERIQDNLALPFRIHDTDVFTGASIGIALSTNGYTKAEDMIRDADTALYRAKSLGRRRYELFDTVMHQQIMRTLRLETDLRHAVERREFQVYYQPIVALPSGNIIGVEALVRWVHPQHGMLPPAEFLPLAEEMGLICAIDWFVIEEACRQVKIWHAQFPQRPPLRLNINLSQKHFVFTEQGERLTTILTQSTIPGSLITVEITETAVMQHPDVALATLHRLQSSGMSIALDDFGTGYSSLNYLHQLPITMLKLDRSFIRQMREDQKTYAIIQTIITLAQTLGLTIVAEGIEIQEQVAVLSQLGCAYGQGYYFSRPMPAHDLTALLGNDSNVSALRPDVGESR